MNTLTIKIPAQLEQDIVQASQREHLTKSELVRRALVAYVSQRQSSAASISALDQAGVKAAFVQAMHAACVRAQELGDEFGR